METYELWQGGLRLLKTDKVFPVTMDSVVLSYFVRPARGKKFLDLGSGSGIISLLLLSHYPSLTATMAEVSAEAAEISRQNLILNGFESRGRVLCTDLRLLHQRDVGLFDIVVTNPPYFKTSGTMSPKPLNSSARLEKNCSLEEVCQKASSLLHTGGRFYMVYPVHRMAEAICTLSGLSLEPKRLRLITARPEQEPSVFLIECIKLGRPSLRVEPTLVLLDEKGGDSREIKEMYHFTR